MNEHPDEVGAPWERELREALAELPQERAPRSLQRNLQRIPARAGGRRWWRQPAWAMALLLPLVAIIGLQQYQLAQQARDIEEARRDLALALSYVEKANSIAASQITAALTAGVAEPVAEQTRQGLQLPLETTLETKL